MGEITNKAEHAGRQTQDNDWFEKLVRVGLVAYGVHRRRYGEAT